MSRLTTTTKREKTVSRPDSNLVPFGVRSISLIVDRAPIVDSTPNADIESFLGLDGDASDKEEAERTG